MQKTPDLSYKNQHTTFHFYCCQVFKIVERLGLEEKVLYYENFMQRTAAQ
jgi:hypothetical protein